MGNNINQQVKQIPTNQTTATPKKPGVTYLVLLTLAASLIFLFAGIFTYFIRNLYDIKPTPLNKEFSKPLNNQGTPNNPKPILVEENNSVAPTTPDTKLDPVAIPFPIGIGITTDEIRKFWNSLAEPSDIVLGYSPGIDSLVAATAREKVLLTNPDNPEPDMDAAIVHSIKTVSANIETNDMNKLLDSEKTQYQMAKNKGLTFNFAPAGIFLSQKYAYNDYAILKNADTITYQTQYLQDNNRELGSDSNRWVANYANKVKNLVRTMRPYIVQHKIWAQVSVNPPNNRCISADQVIKYIDAIEDGSEDSPNGIIIFYSSTYDAACQAQEADTRTKIMRQVIEHYRQ